MPLLLFVCLYVCKCVSTSTQVVVWCQGVGCFSSTDVSASSAFTPQ